MAGLFNSQNFGQKYVERKSPKIYFFFIFRFDASAGRRTRVLRLPTTLWRHETVKQKP